MSSEDRDYEVARRVVRFAGEAAQQAAAAPPSAPPQQVAQAALQTAAQRHAPGLVGAGAPTGAPAQFSGVQFQGGGPRGSFAPGRSGRWVRRGRVIILDGA